MRRRDSPEPAPPPERPFHLVFPSDFLPDERKLAETELAALQAERAQMVLDEIDGRTRKGRRVDTRLGLLYSLVRAEREGRFKPCYALEVKGARDRAAQRAPEEEARERRQGDDPRMLHDRLSPDTDGKSGYEAFKALAARWRRPGAAGEAKSDDTTKP